MTDTLTTFLRNGTNLFLAIAALEFLVACATRLVAKRRPVSGRVASLSRRDPKEAISNFAVYAINWTWRTYIKRGFELAVLSAIYTLAPYKLPSTVWAFGLTLLAADFIYYWKHRAEHSVRLLWAYHAVHHSSHEFNLTTAFRLPTFGSLMPLAFYVPAILLGMNPLAMVISRQIVLQYQFWIHTEQIGKLGWFDRIFNSPSNHRVHHGSNPIYLDRNHAGILILWDRLFGTYQAELASQPVVYGLTTPVMTRNPFAINLHEYLNIARDLKRAKNLKQMLGYLFKGPGWRPADALVKNSSAPPLPHVVNL